MWNLSYGHMHLVSFLEEAFGQSVALDGSAKRQQRDRNGAGGVLPLTCRTSIVRG